MIISTYITSHIVLTNLTSITISDMKDFKVIRTWRHTPKSKTILFTLPLDIAEEYNLLEPANVMVIRRDDGILLKKLELPK